MNKTQFQQSISKLLTETLHENGFALAGGGAIREHGFGNRPTTDIDLFTKQSGIMHQAVKQAIETLNANGFTVEINSRKPQNDTYTQLHVSKGNQTVDIDMCVDWQENPPIHTLTAGFVISEEDAVANKLSAMYRGAARDFVDADAILQSHRYTAQELLQLLSERDKRFTKEQFANDLRIINKLDKDRLLEYLPADQIDPPTINLHLPDTSGIQTNPTNKTRTYEP